MAGSVRIAALLLVDRRGWVLLQERDELAPADAEKWGMVGGHVEVGEEFEPAAYRELAEETGISLPPESLTLWREEDLPSPDGSLLTIRVYVAAVDLTDADIVLGEGRQIVFVDPAGIPDLDLGRSAAQVLPAFLASTTYRRLGLSK
ncbi:MAG: NUDIX domain-containing protein [Actinomycetota bacterium]|nr:NUDIX domain-containing protein [Actinomycetota bacterium]